MKIINAKSPKWHNAEHTQIDMLVDFEEFENDTELPFIADENDSEDHGKSLFARAKAEEFGIVGDYVEKVDPFYNIDSVIADKSSEIVNDRESQIALIYGTTSSNLPAYENRTHRLLATAQIIKLNPNSGKGMLFKGKSLSSSAPTLESTLDIFLTEQLAISAQIEQIILDYDVILLNLANVSSIQEAETFTW